MGMDLIPFKETKEYHANWTGWTLLGDALEIAGADLSKMAGTNDGDIVDQSTAESWYRALNRAVSQGRIRELKVPDHTFEGGRRTEFVAEGGEPLSQESRDWLSGFMLFLATSGGFEQW